MSNRRSVSTAFFVIAVIAYKFVGSDQHTIFGVVALVSFAVMLTTESREKGPSFGTGGSFSSEVRPPSLVDNVFKVVAVFCVMGGLVLVGGMVLILFAMRSYGSNK